MSISDIRKALSSTFQGMLKNIVSLANDSTLESDLKVLKVGEKATPIELSENEVKIKNLVGSIDAAKKLKFDGDNGHTYIKSDEPPSDILTFTVGGEDLFSIAEDASTSVAQSSKVFAACPLHLKDIGGVSDTPASGYGSLYVNSDVLYIKTDGGTATNLLAGGGSTARWHCQVGGYITNNTSTSN